MAKKKVSELVEEILNGFLEQNGMELYNCEFVKEGRDWFLRVYIDKLFEPQSVREQYISTDDCEIVSRYLSGELDRLDPIEQNYFLEVSSPGMDRVLIKDSDFERYSGRKVDVSLYKAIDGVKTISGLLEGLEDGRIIIIDDRSNASLALDRSAVAQVRLAVIL